MSGIGISWAICKSAPRSRQITTPALHHSVLCRLDALPAAQPTASKHWRHCCIYYFLISCLQCFGWFGIRKSMRAVKIDWWGVDVASCLEWGADCLHMVRLMPLHLKTPSSLASFKSRLVLPFWYRLTQVVLEKRPLNGCSSSSVVLSL